LSFLYFSGVYLELTGRCNLNCLYCYNACGKKKAFPIEKLSRLFKEIKHLGAKELVLSGGEPLLYPGLKAALQFSEPLFSLSLVTNATLIDDSWAEFFVSLPGLRLEISLEGVSPEINDQIRGEGSWEKIRRGIEKLLDKALAERITLCLTLNRFNFRHFAQVMEQALAWGIKRLLVSPLVKLGRARENWAELALEPKEKIEVYEKLSEINNQGLEIFGLLPEQLQSFKAGENHYPCPLGEKLHITPELEVYPCGQLAAPEFSLGNLTAKTLTEMVESDSFVCLKNLPVQRAQEIPQCRKCSWVIVCQGGCMAEALNQKGNLYALDPGCELLQHFFEKTL